MMLARIIPVVAVVTALVATPAATFTVSVLEPTEA